MWPRRWVGTGSRVMGATITTGGDARFSPSAGGLRVDLQDPVLSHEAEGVPFHRDGPVVRYVADGGRRGVRCGPSHVRRGDAVESGPEAVEVGAGAGLARLEARRQPGPRGIRVVRQECVVAADRARELAR